LIHEVEGDLLLTKAVAIAHGIAPNDDFHTGLALCLRERWPVMYKDFRHYCQSTHPKPGDAWTRAGADAPRIVSLFRRKAPMATTAASPAERTRLTARVTLSTGYAEQSLLEIFVENAATRRHSGGRAYTRCAGFTLSS